MRPQALGIGFHDSHCNKPTTALTRSIPCTGTTSKYYETKMVSLAIIKMRSVPMLSANYHAMSTASRTHATATPISRVWICRTMIGAANSRNALMIKATFAPLTCFGHTDAWGRLPAYTILVVVSTTEAAFTIGVATTARSVYRLSTRAKTSTLHATRPCRAVPIASPRSTLMAKAAWFAWTHFLRTDPCAIFRAIRLASIFLGRPRATKATIAVAVLIAIIPSWHVGKFEARVRNRNFGAAACDRAKKPPREVHSHLLAITRQI